MRATWSLCLVVLATVATAGADDKKDEKKEAIAKLAKDFKSSTPKGKLAIIEKLTGLGEGAARPLCDALIDKDAKVATAALVALEKVRPALYKPVAKMVLSKDVDDELKGVDQIRELGDDGKPALGLLISRFKYRATLSGDAFGGRPSPEAIDAYFKAVDALGAEEVEVAQVMKELAKGQTWRLKAFEWLVTWAGDKEVRRKELIPFVKEGLAAKVPPPVYIRAAGTLGPLAKELLPRLKQLKLSELEPIREEAAKAVEAIERP